MGKLELNTELIYRRTSDEAGNRLSEGSLHMTRKPITVLILILTAQAVFTVTHAQAATITVICKLDSADPG